MASSTTANQKTFRNYLQFFAGQTVSMLGSSILSFSIIWWVTITYKSPIYLSIAFFFAVGAQVIMGPIGGVIADRFDRKKIILITDALVAVGSLFYFLLFAFEDSLNKMVMLWLVIAVVFFRNVIGAFQGPAVFSIVPSMVPKDKLSRLNGMRFVFFGAINIVGPVIGAILYEVMALHFIILIDVVTFAIAIIPLLLLKIPARENEKDKTNEEIRNPEKKPSFITDFKEGLSYVRGTKGLLGMMLVATFINFFEMPLSVLRPAFVNLVNNGAASDLALIVALGQVGMFTSGIFLTLKKGWKNHTVILMIALYIQIAGYLIQSLAPLGVYWFIGIGALVMGLTFPFTNTMIQTIFQMIIPAEKQGRVGSILGSISSAITPIGMLASGPLAALIGYVPLFVGGIIMGGITITIIWISSNMSNLDKMVEEAKQKEKEEKTEVIKSKEIDAPVAVPAITD